MNKLNEKTQPGRLVHMDLLRIVAAFAVIVIHVCAEDFLWKEHIMGSNWIFIDIYNTLSRFSVPIFIMMSGMFFLNRTKPYDLREIYFKKILRMITSYFFWSVLYAALHAFVLKEGFELLKFGNKVLVGGEYHLWFLPAIVFLYAAYPVLKHICKDKKIERYFLALGAACFLIKFVVFAVPYTYFLAELSREANYGFVAGYVFYFIAGHYFSNYDVKKKYRIIIYTLAVASCAVTAFLIYNNYRRGIYESDLYDNLLITTAITSIAVFLIFKYGVSKINFGEKASKFIVKLSSLTFGIYLTHLVFIDIIDLSRFNKVNRLIFIPAYSLVVFVLSTVVSYIINKIPLLKKYIV